MLATPGVVDLFSVQKPLVGERAVLPQRGCVEVRMNNGVKISTYC